MSMALNPKFQIPAIAKARNSAIKDSFVEGKDFKLSEPQLIEDGSIYRERFPNDNSIIKVTTIAGGAWDVNDSVVLGYCRRYWQEVRMGLGHFKVPARDCETLYDLIPFMTMYYGFDITSDDVEDAEIVYDPDTGEGTVPIVAKSGSMGWVGEETITVTLGAYNIKDILIETNLDGLYYPEKDTVSTKGFAYSYCYAIDFTSMFDSLIDLETGSGVTQYFVTAFNAKVGGSWIFDETKEDNFNLAGATVIHDGLNSNELNTNNNYKYAVIIKLSDSLCKNFQGSLYLHFNDIPNPDDI